MGLFSGCLLACDIDGTLTSENVIAKRNIEKINYFVKEGGIFSLSTGRSVGAVSVVLEQLPGLIGPSVVSNGAMMYDYSTNQILDEITLNDSDRHIILNIYNDLPNIGIEIHSGKNVMIMRRNREIDDHEFHEKLDSFEVMPNEAFSSKWTKVLLAADDDENRERLYEYVDSLYPEASIFIRTAAFLDGIKRRYVEMLPEGVSKNIMLNKLCRMLKIKKGRCFAIGDYYNDLDMLKGADYSACPEDSPEDIKNEVDFIVGTAKEGAVADFIDRLSKIIL